MKIPRIDHVLIATVDPTREIEQLRSLGLPVSEGIEFEDGVRNSIVYMKSGQYLEVLSADPDNEAGAWIRDCVAAGSRFAAWAVEVPSVDDVAERLGLPVSEGLAIKGQEGAAPWRTVDSPRGSFLPFFITYAWTNGPVPEYEKGRAAFAERVAGDDVPIGISSMTLTGDHEELRSWVGAELPVTVQPGAARGLSSVTVSTKNGDVVLKDLTA